MPTYIHTYMKLDWLCRGDMIIFNNQYRIFQQNPYKSNFEFHEVAQCTQVIFALAQ